MPLMDFAFSRQWNYQVSKEGGKLLTTRCEIRQFIIEFLSREHSLPADQDIEALAYIDEGYADSMSVLRLVLELESNFGVRFEDGDLSSPAFRTVGGLLNLIEQKLTVI